MLICPGGLQIHATPCRPISALALAAPGLPCGSGVVTFWGRVRVLLGGSVHGRVSQGDFRGDPGPTISLLVRSIEKKQAFSMSGRPWEDVIAED